MKYKCILLLFNGIFSQDNKEIRSIDSLWTIVKNDNAYSEKGSKEMLRLCTEIYYQSKNVSYDKGQLRAIIRSSEIYLNEQNYGESSKKISEGIKLAEQTNDYHSWSSLLILQGRIQTDLGYFKEGRSTFKKGLLISDKVSNKDVRHTNKSVLYLQMGYSIDSEELIADKKIQYDSILYYFHKAYEESKKISNLHPKKINFHATNALNLGSSYFYQNNISEAEKYLDEFQLLMMNEKNKANFIVYYRLKGENENKKGNYLKAIEYFNQAITVFKEYNLLLSELIKCYSGLAKAYEGSKDYKNQAEYLEKAKRITDSMSFEKKKAVEKAVPENRRDDSKSNTVFILVGFIILLLISGCLYFFFQKKVKKEIIKETQPENLDSESIKMDPVQEMQLQNLSNTIPTVNDVIELARSNDKSFGLKFSQLYPQFNKKLLALNPQLTHLDLEYCALIKLNFDTKEIAQFKNISIGSVESRKYRIRKKLIISTHENMYIWFINL